MWQVARHCGKFALLPCIVNLIGDLGARSCTRADWKPCDWQPCEVEFGRTRRVVPNVPRLCYIQNNPRAALTTRWEHCLLYTHTSFLMRWKGGIEVGDRTMPLSRLMQSTPGKGAEQVSKCRATSKTVAGGCSASRILDVCVFLVVFRN